MERVGVRLRRQVVVAADCGLEWRQSGRSPEGCVEVADRLRGVARHERRAYAVRVQPLRELHGARQQFERATPLRLHLIDHGVRGGAALGVHRRHRREEIVAHRHATAAVHLLKAERGAERC